MSKLYIITGPAGVGKSTISKGIAESLQKSALIEGDDIYAFVCGGYVSPWKEGNHMKVFWENSIDIIKNFLDDGYDVVFNYIINPKELSMIKSHFENVETKFAVLLVDEETIMKRDALRPEDCQMKERCIVLLNEMKEHNYDEKNIIDTSNLSIEETVKSIVEDDRFIIL